MPAIAVFGWAFTQADWWKWPLLLFNGLWALVWGGVGLAQLRKERKEATELEAEA